MPEIKINSNCILKLLSWTALLLSIICSYSVFTPLTHIWLTCSDALAVQFIYDDLIAGTGALKDWYFPAAPAAFPDLTFFSIIQIFHCKFMISLILYALLQMSVISLLGIYIFKKTVTDRMKSLAWLVPLVFSIIFMEAYYFTKDITINQLLTSCFYHAGPFVNCLIIYSVFLSNWRYLIKYIFFLVFSFIAVFNDMLFVVMFVVPFSLSSLITINRINFKQNLIFILCLGIGTFTGLKFYNYVKDSGITYFYKPEKMFAFSDTLPSLKIFTEQMVNYMLAPGFRSFHIIFTFLSIPAALVLYLFKRKNFSNKMNFFLVFLVIFSGCVLSAPIINGNYIASDTLRYNVACFYLSIITLSFFIAYLLAYKINKANVRKMISIALPSVLIVLILIKFSPKGLKEYSNYYPDRVKTIDSLVDKYQLKRGIYTQKYSKVITLFTKKNLEILPIQVDGCIFEFGSNISWYYDKDFDFVVVEASQTDLGNKFKIKDTVFSKGFSILRVENFRYFKGRYAPVTK